METSRRIRRSVRQSDTLARLGGDEFTLILADIGRPGAASIVAEKVIRSLQEGFQIDGREVFIGASIGIGLYPDDGGSVSTLIKNADTAMYLAKQAGRGVCRFFTSEMNSRNERRMTMEACLRPAEVLAVPRLSRSADVGQSVGPRVPGWPAGWRRRGSAGGA